MNEILPSFIGVDTFNCSNVFMDLADHEHILICLEQQRCGFCFKGKCSASLIFGQIEIAGHILVNRSVEDDDAALKWFNLYSPDTNAYLSILNVNNDGDDLNQEIVHNSEQLISSLMHKILNQVKIDDEKKNLEKLMNDLKAFLNSFPLSTSSFVLLRSLNSNMCNYLSSFKNFSHIYHDQLNFNNDHQLQQNQIDAAFIQTMGIYPIRLDYFDSVLIRRDDEREIFKKLSNTDAASAADRTAPVILCAGGKDVGKSTFLRNLINAYLSKCEKVVYLDCDPGQCEFTLSGCISVSTLTEPLFGPPHTHLNHHDGSARKCFYLGHLSPNDVPLNYLECVRKCFDEFKQQHQQNSSFSVSEVPLIVNTMGWNQGLGLCLLKEIILLVQPTHIVQINHPIQANKNMPTLNQNWLKMADGWPSRKLKENNYFSSNSCGGGGGEETMMMEAAPNTIETNETTLIESMSYKLIILKSATPNKTQRDQVQVPQKRISPKDHRNIATIAYFSSLQQNHNNNSNSINYNLSSFYYRPISQLRPFKVNWSNFAIHVNHVNVPYEELLYSINASLVSLCRVDPKFIKRVDEKNELPGYLHPYDRETNMHAIFECIGFGIVRGINTETKQFYILCPEPVEKLAHVNLIAKGVLSLPLEFFIEQDLERQTPYMTYSVQQQQQQQYQHHQQSSAASSNYNNFQMIGSQPVKRKYLIHQNRNNNQTNQQQQHQQRHQQQPQRFNAQKTDKRQ